MRLKRHLAALALAGAAAAAGPAPGEAAGDRSVDAPPADVLVPSPVRIPEINVTVAPPDVAVEVDTPALRIGRGGDWAVRLEGLPELKRRLDRGQWRAMLDVVEGPLRARLSRDPMSGFRVWAQSTPGPTPVPPPPVQPPQPGQPRNPDQNPLADPNADARQHERLLELYRAQTGGPLQMQKAAYLGVSTSAVPDALRQHLGLKEGVGLVVDFVEKGSPAEQAGVKQYDILNKLDDQILVNAHQLAVLVRARKAGESVNLSVIRGGKEQSIPAKLVEKEVKPLNDIGFGFWEGGQPGRGGIHFNRVEDDDIKAWAPDGKPQRNFEFHSERKVQRNENKTTNNGKQKLRLQSRDASTMVFTDDAYQLILTSPGRDGKERHLTAVEKASGKVIFDGKLDDGDPGDTKLPPPIAERLKQLDEAGKGDPGNKGARRAETRFEVELGRPGKQATIKKDKDEEEAEEKEDDADDDNDDDGDDCDDGDDDEKGGEDAGRRAAGGAHKIRPDDVVKLYIADLQGPGVETIKVARVRGGAVSLPYVGVVRAEGLTEHELERNIVKAYADAKLVQNANVQVKLVPAGDPEREAVKP